MKNQKFRPGFPILSLFLSIAFVPVGLENILEIPRPAALGVPVSKHQNFSSEFPSIHVVAFSNRP